MWIQVFCCFIIRFQAGTIPLSFKLVEIGVGSPLGCAADYIQIILKSGSVLIKFQVVYVSFLQQFFGAGCIKSIAGIAGIGPCHKNASFVRIDQQFPASRIDSHIQFFAAFRAEIISQVKIITDSGFGGIRFGRSRFLKNIEHFFPAHVMPESELIVIVLQILYIRAFRLGLTFFGSIGFGFFSCLLGEFRSYQTLLFL